MELLILAFLFKHFLCDFVFQYSFHYKNKGTYGHIGGIEHAFIHTLGTAAVLLVLTPYTSFTITLGLLDGAIHYHIDWAKMNINKKVGWTPANSDYYWWLLGLDQLLHYLTYAGVIALL